LLMHSHRIGGHDHAPYQGPFDMAFTILLGPRGSQARNVLLTETNLSLDEPAQLTLLNKFAASFLRPQNTLLGVLHALLVARPDLLHWVQGKVEHTAASVRELILSGVSPSLQADPKSRAAAFLSKVLGLKPGQLERNLGLEVRPRSSRPAVAQDPTIVLNAFENGWHGPVVPGMVGG
jgi:hypothetical protein